MSDDRREERGPLGDEEETRRVSREEQGEGEETREISSGGEEPTRRIRRRPWGGRRQKDEEHTSIYDERGGETGEDRTVRVPGSGTAEMSAGGRYYEALEERYRRMHELHGGADWLASFVGMVFAAVVFSGLLGVAAVVLVPLGLTPGLAGVELSSAVITGLVVVGLVIFLSYLVGGYVAGRLARFDGGLNGVMVVIWSAIILALLGVAGGVLANVVPGPFFAALSEAVAAAVGTAGAASANLGYTALGIAVGGVIVAVLGGFVGGRMGSRYHREIDLMT